MSDDAIEKILDELIPTPFPDQNMGLLPDEEDRFDTLQRQANEKVILTKREAAQQIREYIETEIIGEDNYINKLSNNSRFNQQVTSEINGENKLRAEQRRKL